jgi:hypothetical protein
MKLLLLLAVLLAGEIGAAEAVKVEANELYSRTFRLDPNSFGEKTGFFSFGPEPLEQAKDDFMEPAFSFGSRHETSGPGFSERSKSIRAFFAAAGVEFPAAPADGAGRKAFYFNERRGFLYVRASARELDVIEQALETIKAKPAQVQLTATFIEFGTNDVRFMNSFSGAKMGNEETNGVFRGVLTEPQFRAAMQALQNQQGVNVISAPRVTTMSGRQARVSVGRYRRPPGI